MQGLIAELRRRNVFLVAAVYGVVGWVIAQVAVVLETALGLPLWFDGLIVTMLLLGFPVALILAWAFELTEDGFRPTEADAASPARRLRNKQGLNLTLAAALALAVAFIAFDTAVLDRRVVPQTLTASALVAPVDDASIAVLPFSDRSEDADSAFLGDGIAEELLNLLAEVDGLRVASRTSSFTFRDRMADITEIAEALAVAHVLEGSVQRAGDRIRITARLVDTRTDAQAWAGAFDRDLTAENLFDIQDEIARAIVGELQGTLQLAARGELPTVSTEAYSAFLSGRAKIETRRRDAVLDGLADLQRAVALDPDFTEAHIFLARGFALARTYAGRDRESSIRLADRHLDIAEAQDPDHPRLALERAWSVYDRHEIDPVEQIAAFETAIAANPREADAHRGLAMSKMNIGRHEEAVAHIEAALELDPTSVIALINAGHLMTNLRRVDEAKRYYLRVLDVDPGNVAALQRLSELTLQTGKVALAHRMMMSGGNEPVLERLRRHLYAELGMDAALENLDANVARGVRALEAGDRDALAEAYQLAEANHQYRGLFLIDTAGTADLMRESFEADAGAYDYVTKEDGKIDTASYADIALSVEHAFAETRPDAAAIAGRKLDAFYADRSVADFGPVADAVNLARWHARRGRAEAAIATLKSIADRGVPMRLRMMSYDFDDVRDDPDFAAVIERDAATVEHHREAIAAQLAAPPALWWSPDEGV